jgi:nucleoid-associated protein YgaU
MGVVALFAAGMPLFAADGDNQYSDFVNSLVNNKFLQENKRLMDLAEKSYTEGKYDESIKYSQEAVQNAQKSDEWVAAQVKMREANDTIDAAQKRFDWATAKDAETHYATEYGEAKTALADALKARTGEKWDQAIASAKKVLAALSGIPDTPVFAARYKVKSWQTQKECLWNIAALPQIYSDPFQWRAIYNANKAKFPKPDNPNIIEPGMILDIPSIKGETRAGLLE